MSRRKGTLGGENIVCNRGAHKPRGSRKPTRAAEIARFWLKVDSSGGPDACWPWTASTKSNGYGQVGFADRNQRAHRIACLLGHGEPASDDLFACHSLKCNTRLCCNPDHLRWDTHEANQADVRRLGTVRGSNHARAKLDEQKVLAMRADRNVGPAELGRRFGVSRGTAWNAMAGRTWAHVGNGIDQGTSSGRIA